MNYILYNTTSNNYIDENDKKILILSNLKRVNILSGENNAGKSRFIRSLIQNSNDNKCLLYNEKNILSENLRRIEVENNDILSYIKFNYKERYLEINKNCQNMGALEKFEYLYKTYYNDLSLNNSNANIVNAFNRIIDYYLANKQINNSNFYYIPILRGIENFEVYFDGKENLNNIQMTLPDMDKLNKYIGQANCIYKTKVKRIYKIQEEKIFTAENLYDEVVEILLGEEERRIKFHEFERFISNNFYNGEGFTINPNKKNSCLMVKIKNSVERKIYDLGDGIKQLIVLLYQIYMHKDEDYIFFIEEPEINLHPGFQRKFMEILLSKDFEKHIYFINTHSNHIIDIVNENKDCKILKFRQSGSKTEIKEIQGEYISLLNELGIRSSSVFLSNCTIWGRRN